MTNILTQTPNIIPQANIKLSIKMQKSRGVPLFICAPRKTGRTDLALSYARQTYQLDEVLWVDCTCAGFDKAVGSGKVLEHLGSQLANGISQVKLIVFDDLPHLDTRVCKIFSDWIDEMIDGGTEIVIITTPQEDCLKNYQSDRFLINGENLIFFGQWNKKRRLEVLRSFFDSEIDTENLSLAALMILMRRGIVDNLRSLGYVISAGAHVTLKPLCPLIDIDEHTGFFDASALPIKELSEQLLTNLCLAGVAQGDGDKSEMTESECCFERLTQLSTHLFERGDREQSQAMLELAGTLLTHDDAGYPLEERSVAGEGERVVAEAEAELPSCGEAAWNRSLRLDEDLEDEADAEDASSVSPLFVRLFGDFEVLKGGRRIESKDLHRQKVRVLLIHLALNKGRGVSRDLLMEQIWPEKDYLHAKDNFYSTWSKLSHLLSSGDKSQPYLSNNRGICKLENALVRTDVNEFEQLARAILFQKGSVDERIEAIYRAEQLYRGDILSGCYVDAHVQAAQHKYRSLLVDMMLEASHLFSEEGSDVNAVWFARKAYDTDSSREDVYRVLMSVQDKAGQRTSALQTYFDCKRFLSEELGILPSQKTIDLYQDLILDRR